MQAYASKGVEVRVASLNLDSGATCKVSDGAATGAAKKKRFKTCWIWARKSGILGVMDGGVHIGDEEGTRASKEHPKPDFLRCWNDHLWCLQGSTAGRKLCCDSISAKGYVAMSLVLPCFRGSDCFSGWLQFEYVNLREWFLTFCMFCRDI